MPEELRPIEIGIRAFAYPARSAGCGISATSTGPDLVPCSVFVVIYGVIAPSYLSEMNIFGSAGPRRPRSFSHAEPGGLRTRGCKRGRAELGSGSAARR
jgi:hypothetical protein